MRTCRIRPHEEPSVRLGAHVREKVKRSSEQTFENEKRISHDCLTFETAKSKLVYPDGPKPERGEGVREGPGLFEK